MPSPCLLLDDNTIIITVPTSNETLLSHAFSKQWIHSIARSAFYRFLSKTNLCLQDSADIFEIHVLNNVTTSRPDTFCRHEGRVW